MPKPFLLGVQKERSGKKPEIRPSVQIHNRNLSSFSPVVTLDRIVSRGQHVPDAAPARSYQDPALTPAAASVGGGRLENFGSDGGLGSLFTTCQHRPGIEKGRYYRKTRMADQPLRDPDPSKTVDIIEQRGSFLLIRGAAGFAVVERRNAGFIR